MLYQTYQTPGGTVAKLISVVLTLGVRLIILVGLTIVVWVLVGVVLAIGLGLVIWAGLEIEVWELTELDCEVELPGEICKLVVPGEICKTEVTREICKLEVILDPRERNERDAK